jgi:mRNA-degrading endonuclease RelE of RelBE toxin-antitoxin system
MALTKTSVLWSFWRSTKFKKRFRKLEDFRKEKATKAIIELGNAVNPLSLGIQKHGSLRDYWAYELGQECRILYNIDANTRTINLHRICSHKEAYA